MSGRSGPIFASAILLLVLLPGLGLFPAAAPSDLSPVRRPQRADGLYAQFRTTRGEIVARLEYEKTPLAVASFVGLAEGTIANEAFAPGEAYYDGSVFHRVIEGHVIQAGMPAPDRSDAQGPGYTFPNEIHADLSHDHAGALGVANGGPHTNGAQFYITLGDRSYLDGDYIVFGEVVAGMDVVEAIEQGDVIESVRIERLGDAAQGFRPDTTAFETMVEKARVRVADDSRDRRSLERRWVGLNFDLGGTMPALDRVLRIPRRLGRGGLVAGGDRVAVRYAGIALRYRGHMLGARGAVFEEIRFASSAEGTPQRDNLDGVVFEYVVGESSVTPGFDEVIAEMRPGGHEIAVVWSHLAYGARGFYGPNRPGRERMVIPPDTMVVYAIEVLEQ